jgi:hypothetical protein
VQLILLRNELLASANARFPPKIDVIGSRLTADRPDQCRQTGNHRGQSEKRGWIEKKHNRTPIFRSVV